MRKIVAITIKEFCSYLSGPGIYVLSGLLMTLLGWTYFALIQRFSRQSMMMLMQTRGQGGGLDIHQEVFFSLLSNLNLFFLFLAPVLTMKLLSEEKKMRTMDLLLTSPITSLQIVLGKFLAATLVVTLLTGLSFIYPVITSYYAEVHWGYLFSGYLSVFLVTLMYIAIGLFASSLTESLIISMVIGIVLSLGAWFIAWGTTFVENPTFTAILEHISTPQHFGDMLRGSVEISGIVFLLSVVTLFTFMADRVVESTRWR